MTRIIIIDAQQITREGIKSLLESRTDIQVVGDCDIPDALDLLEKTKPDVIMLNTNTTSNDSVRVVKNIKAQYPESKIIILTSEFEGSHLQMFVRAGVKGFLNSHSSDFDLAIDTVARGLGYVDLVMGNSILIEFQKLLISIDTRSYNPMDVRRPLHLLTRRECEVLQQLASGKNNRDIGISLFISEKTVKNHVSSIMLKMNVKDRTQAVIKAIKNDWVVLI